MPVLYILGGPNGTGKTTFYSIAVQNSFIAKDLPFVNVDLITQSLGGYSEENYIKAEAVYRAKVKDFIDSQTDFMIESNLADNRSYDWIKLIKKQGYDVVLYYLSTDDVAINIGRVQRRVAEGGHDIPEEIIKTRYTVSHSYLKTKLTEFKEIYLIDNSTDSSEIALKLVDGIIVLRSENIQNWIKEVITVHEKLQTKVKK